jgi:hypothetical protein
VQNHRAAMDQPVVETGPAAPTDRSSPMEAAMSSENQTHDLVVTRSFNAPQERVWRAWSDPD